MKPDKSLFLVLAIFMISSCQTLTPTPPPLQTAAKATATAGPSREPTSTPQPATEPPTVTPTLISVSEESLAGLIISSPILGTPLEHPELTPPQTITPNGLGIIDSEGRLVKFADVGLFEDVSPSGIRIVYQHGFADEMTDYIDDLYVYNIITGETTEITDHLEHEGGKTVLAWSNDEETVFYYNDYQTILFEAYGYFGTKQLLLADVITGRTNLAIPDGYQFDVSPDRTKIAYTTGYILDEKTKTYGGQPLEKFGCFQPHIYDVASASSSPFDVSQLDAKPVCVGYPKWSPDGNKIAWMAYFRDDTFRPIIFDLQDKDLKVYEALGQKPESSSNPTSWFFGEPFFGGLFEPDWIDTFTFWTPSYEVNTETGETSTPREIEMPYNPRRHKFLHSPDRSFNVSLSEARDTIVVTDVNGNLLSSFLLTDLYDGPKQEILPIPFYVHSRANIEDWSPFYPSSITGSP